MTPREQSTIDRATRILAKYCINSDFLEDPDAVRKYLKVRLGAVEREEFHCVYLNTQHRVLSTECLFQGTLSQTSVFPREVVKSALKYNAGAVVLAHNHPSGISEPSRADELLTQSLKKALELVDVRVLDHFIVAGTQTMSFAERGLI